MIKNLYHVYCFEAADYFKSKSYMLATILICVFSIAAITILGIFSSSDSSDGSSDNAIAGTIAIFDQENLIEDSLISSYGKTEIRRLKSEAEVKSAVESNQTEVGFVVRSPYEYDYYVLNKSITEDVSEIFSELMSSAAKMKYCESHHLDYKELTATEKENIICNEKILGKDSTSNYWYSYIFVLLVFMIIVMYGMVIATSVANEKSNRTVELLVTSTPASSLLFGKVLAGATAILFQFGLILASILGAYQFNRERLGGMLDIVLNIPSNVLVTFAVFGLGGFLIYAFMYGALGGLVSKIEDLNKSAGTAQMLVMIIYFVVLFQMQEPDGIIIRILSFLPVSSYSAMFIRIAMGTVSTWEIVVSAVLLYASVIGMGIAAAKIFRNSTLRYGNPIKLTNALKSLRSNDT